MKKITCKMDLGQLNIKDAVGGKIEIKDVVLMKDMVMYGNIAFYVPPVVLSDSLPLWENAPIIAPEHMDDFRGNIFGSLSNPSIINGDLVADSSINLDDLMNRYQKLYRDLITGKPINASVDFTSFGFDITGNYRGGRFNYLVTEIVKVNNYAMLQDELGACNIYQGCGFNVSATKTKEATMPELDLTGLAVELGVMKSQVATIQANQTQFKPAICERDFSDLVGRVTANETATQKLDASYQSALVVTEEIKQLKSDLDELKAEVGTLRAAQTQQKNNNTGAKVEASEGDSDSEWGF